MLVSSASVSARDAGKGIATTTGNENWERATLDVDTLGGCFLLRDQSVVRAVKNVEDWNTGCPVIFGQSIGEPTVCKQLDFFKPGDMASVTRSGNQVLLSVDSEKAKFNNLLLSEDPQGRWLRTAHDNIMYYVFLINDPSADNTKINKLYRVEAFDIGDGPCIDTELPAYNIEPWSCTDAITSLSNVTVPMQGDVGEGYEPRVRPRRDDKDDEKCPTEPWTP
jgi:hypothetical protein